MIIIDTNIIIDCKNLMKEIKKFSEFGEPVILDTTIKELERMKNRKGNLALELIKQYNIKIIKSNEKSTDEGIINIATKNDLVATNDKNLIKKLKLKGIGVLRLRQKKYLTLER